MMKITNFEQNSKIKLKSFYRKTIHKDFSMRPHSHEYIEIMNIISGECLLDIYQNNKISSTIRLAPNSIVVITSNKYHCLRTKEDVTIQNLEFEASLYRGQQFVDTIGFLKQNRDWLKLEREKDGITVFTDTNDTSNSILHIILRVKKVGLINNDIYLDSSIFHFFVKLCEAFRSNLNTDKSGTYYINKALTIIKQNYNKEIQVSYIAKELGVSVSYLERVFKKSIHLTVKKYMELLKLDLIKESLVNTNESLDDLCKKFGYKNVIQLSYQFKKTYNMTPRAYRKDYLNKEIFGTDEQYKSRVLQDNDNI